MRRSTTCARVFAWICQRPGQPVAVLALRRWHSRRSVIRGKRPAPSDRKALLRTRIFSGPDNGVRPPSPRTTSSESTSTVNSAPHGFVAIRPVDRRLPLLHRDGQPVSHLRGPAGDPGADHQLTVGAVEAPDVGSRDDCVKSSKRCGSELALAPAPHSLPRPATAAALRSTPARPSGRRTALCLRSRWRSRTDAR